MTSEESASPIRQAEQSEAEELRTARTVLFISRDFPPSLEMGARSCAQIARYLHLYGWTPVVLTAREQDIEERYLDRSDSFSENTFAGSIVRARTLPHPLDMIRWISRWARRRKRRWSRWWWLPEVASSGADPSQAKAAAPIREKSWINRVLLSLLTVPDMTTGWFLPATLAGWRLARQRGAQVVFSSGPMWTNHLVGYAVAKLCGLPWIVHLRDPWASGAIMWELSTTLSDRIQALLERRALERASAVICVTNEHTLVLQRAYPHLPAAKFITVPNGFDDQEWAEIDLESRSPNDKFTIIYAGQIYMQRSPKAIFRALNRLIAEGEIERGQLQIDFIGWCEMSESRRVEELAAEHGLANAVSLTGPRSREETLRRLTRSDLLLLLAEEFVIQIPGKTYEYLKARRPILALTPKDGAVAHLLKQTGSGWVVDRGDDEGLRAALLEAIRAWKRGEIARQADQAVIERFNRRRLSGEIASTLDGCLTRNSLREGKSIIVQTGE